MQEEHTQKSPVKKILYILGNTKKKQISDKKIYYFTTTLLLFTIRNLSFYIFQNTMYFLTGLLCIHFSFKYLPIYFNVIIFGDIELWDFKIF
jgi:hypothetical protein